MPWASLRCKLAFSFKAWLHMRNPQCYFFFFFFMTVREVKLYIRCWLNHLFWGRCFQTIWGRNIWLLFAKLSSSAVYYIVQSTVLVTWASPSIILKTCIVFVLSAKERKVRVEVAKAQNMGLNKTFSEQGQLSAVPLKRVCLGQGNNLLLDYTDKDYFLLS